MELALRSLYENVLIYHPRPVLLFFVRPDPIVPVCLPLHVAGCVVHDTN